jgi:soluble lytic murein transglycosylase-like protein
VAARLIPATLALVLAVPLPAGPPAETAAANAAFEREIAASARAGRWNETLTLLVRLKQTAPERYEDGRFDYLAARALAATSRTRDALVRFEHYVTTDDLFDVPARLAAGSLRFESGDGLGALELLLPLLQRKGGAVSRRALRIALDALETRLDPAALERLVSARPPAAPRERRRLSALRAEALDASGDVEGAEALREEILAEAKRDDAAAVVLAKEIRGADFGTVPTRLLLLLIDTARAQRDMELAERLAKERDRRAAAPGSTALPEERWAARFDLSRLHASRGKFQEAADGFRSLLATRPARPKRSASRKDDGPGTAAFFARARFNLAAALERLGALDEAASEFQKTENERAGPWGLAVLQRARLEMRRGNFALAETLLTQPAIAREQGRVEGLLHLVARRIDAGDAKGAARVLARVDALARGRRLKEPWKSELPFWKGRVAEAADDTQGALAGYARILSTRPYTAVGEVVLKRVEGFDDGVRAGFVRESRARGEALLVKGDARGACDKLLPPALLGDASARDLLRLAYQKRPGYAEVLLAPDLAEDALPTLCGDAAACRLLQLGLPVEAEPIVRDSIKLDTLLGCVVAARLAEGADAGIAALEAAEALDRKIPDDFLLDLAPRAIVRGLAPRPFDRLVTEAAEENRVPRDLLYAIMRQESRFDREAASPAAARGLMQLTLPAAGDAARELNESPPAYAELYDPARSLRLGAHTLKTLLERFKGDAAQAVSGYNAGAGQTALWSGDARTPAEALLGSISYTETRTYFRRVLANRILYRLATPPVTSGK